MRYQNDAAAIAGEQNSTVPVYLGSLLLYIVGRAEFKRRQRSILRSGRGGNTLEGIGDCKRIQLVGDCRLRRWHLATKPFIYQIGRSERGLSFQFHSTFVQQTSFLNKPNFCLHKVLLRVWGRVVKSDILKAVIEAVA